MSPFLPAARAHQVVRHPGILPYIESSPGAKSDLDHWNEDYIQVSDPLTSGVPGSSISFSSTQGLSTILTAVQVAPLAGIPTLSQSSSASSPSSQPTSPAVINVPTITPSSLPPTTTTSTFTPSTATPQGTGPSFHSTTSTPDIGATTPSTGLNSVLSGSTSGAKTHPGPSGGTIAAIVIVILLAMGALAFFLFRRHRIQRRTARRAWTINAWRPPVASASLEKGATEINPISLPDIGAAAGLSSTRGDEGGTVQQPRVWAITRKSPPSEIPQIGGALATLPPSHNSPAFLRAPSPQPQPSTVLTAASDSSQPAAALVRVTFVPQLPDELAIKPGETLYIRTEFDDGWALCANTRGEQGMVPLECLEGGGQLAGLPPLSLDWNKRNSRRVSSLRSFA